MVALPFGETAGPECGVAALAVYACKEHDELQCQLHALPPEVSHMR